MTRLECSQNYVIRWKERFIKDRLSGLFARHQGRKPSNDSAAIEAWILERTAKVLPTERPTDDAQAG